MSEPRIVSRQGGLYEYVIYEDGDVRWWKIHRPGDETPDYYDEHDGDLIADLLSWLHTQRDKAEAELTALRAEVERLREAVLAAYRKGHHRTVNGGYQWCDQGGREIVEEIILEAMGGA